jgi:hypothetical protein
MPATISGKEWVIGDLFSREFVFSIPPYQRPYAWEEEEACALFDDLLASMGSTSKEKLETVAPYFLGSVVVIKPDGNPCAEVVDGQQRLTTLTILIAALCAEVPMDFRSAIRGLLYDDADPLRGTPNRYRLTLRERDAQFFQKYVQVEGALDKLAALNVASLSDSQKNLLQNARALRERVRALEVERRTLLARYVATRCFLVVVSTPTFESAFRIFSVLNDRGLDLSHADVLKADVLGAIPREDERGLYADKWEGVEEELGRDPFRNLFSHIRTIFVRKKVEKSVLEEIRKEVKPETRPKWFVDDVIVPYADALAIVQNAAYQNVADVTAINGKLQWLGKIDNVDWVPAALVIVSRWQNEPVSLERCVGALERLASALMVGRADITERSNRYGSILKTLAECGFDVAAAVNALVPTGNEIRRAAEVVNGSLYLMPKVRAYVLLRLDAALATSEAPHPRANPTVEHVLPQTPEVGSKWLTWWPDEAVRTTWTHRLGNLVLLTQRKNSQAGRLDFDEKKKKYFSNKAGVSDFPLTTQVLQETDWTPVVVARRQTDLLAIVERLWKE